MSMAMSYESDFHAWAIETAEKIRSGDLRDIEWPNGAEELESLGKSEHGRLESLLEVILLRVDRLTGRCVVHRKAWSQTVAARCTMGVTSVAIR
jgi:hypothetical protein